MNCKRGQASAGVDVAVESGRTATKTEQADLADAIKEYDRIVDGRPEVRKQLEQTNPALVSAALMLLPSMARMTSSKRGKVVSARYQYGSWQRSPVSC